MSSRSPDDSAHLLEAFRRGLKEGGFTEGENVAIEFRWARGDYGRLPALATNLVSRRVNVISALGGPPSALAAKGATSTIPIVSSFSADTTGLVESFNRPGGNVTGFALETDLMDPKRRGLLRDLAPGVLLFGALVNPNYPAVVSTGRPLVPRHPSAGWPARHIRPVTPPTWVGIAASGRIDSRRALGSSPRAPRH